MIPAPADTQRRIADAQRILLDLRQYWGSDQYRLMLELLVAVEGCYRETLLFAPLDKVAHLQGAADQTRRLFNALAAEQAPHSPPIVG